MNYNFNKFEALNSVILPKEVLALVKSRYAEQGRHYHTFDHALAVLKEVISLRELFKNDIGFEAAKLAAIFHDVIYYVGMVSAWHESNEEFSAQLFITVMGAWKVPFSSDDATTNYQKIVKLAALMIRCTQFHRLPNTPGGIEEPKISEEDIHSIGIFLDADLSILGASAADFQDFEDKIRKEYHMYSDADYAAGRIKVMSSFLDRPFIYFTREISECLEMRARKNILNLINTLKTKKENMLIGVISGSYDPITNGHVWVIKQALQTLGNGKLIVAIGVNAKKTSMFTADERKRQVHDVLKDALPESDFARVEIKFVEGELLVNFANDNCASIIFRGIRNSEDFLYESQIQDVNRKIQPHISTVFFIPPAEMSSISSSIVKGLVGFAGWEKVVEEYIHGSIIEAFKEKMK